MLRWDDSLETGIKIIDDQHKAIITKANKILKMDANTDKSELSEIISFLMSYTNNHFLEEERLMIESNYDKFIEHRQEHNLFVEEIYRIYLRINNNGIDTKIFDDLKNIMVNWLERHLHDADRDFATHINKAKKDK